MRREKIEGIKGFTKIKQLQFRDEVAAVFFIVPVVAFALCTRTLGQVRVSRGSDG